MAKLNSSRGIMHVDIEDIILKDNVRVEYLGTEELASSIERDGLLQPVVITSKKELIAGYRRVKAHKLLVSQGKPFNQIECIIKTGNFEILQLTENIQRLKLQPAELEKALKKMIDSGMSQKDIAERLNKRLSWVSDSLAAGKVRQALENAGIPTAGLSTSAIGQARSVPKEELPGVIKAAQENGGTVKAVKDEVQKNNPDLSKVKTQIQCNRECIHNSFHKKDFGYCQKKKIYLNEEFGCTNFKKTDF